VFGYDHPLSKKPKPGKIIFGLSFYQLIVVLLGAKLSWQMSTVIPAIPVKNFTIAHIHHLIPFGLTVMAVFTKQSKTGLPIAVYFYYWVLFKMRKRTYVWRRV
jgi:hypothetical protein